MSGRKWVPAEWMDEMVPAMSASPDDFLKRDPNGVLQLMPIDRHADEVWPPIEDLQRGQEIEFCWMEDRGTSVLTMRGDGTWSCEPSFEADTNHIGDADGDIIADSVADYVQQRALDDPLKPGEHTLWGWTWSDSIKFRVKVLESGAASFERVDG